MTLRCPQGGFVSIHWRRRTFEGGICTPRPAKPGAKTYEGRGWRQRLMADAVAWLQKIYEE